MNDKKVKILVCINIFGILVLMINCYYITKEEANFKKLTNNVNYKDYKNEMIRERDSIFKDIELKEKVNSIDDLVEYKEELNKNYKLLLKEEIAANEKILVLKNQKNDTNNKYNELYQKKIEAERIKREQSRFMIDGVSTINQYYLGYPTGCESAALTLLLNFWGISINMSDVVSNLPKGSLPYFENDIKYGGNPYLEFVGTPTSYHSYGTYDKVIEGVANKYKPGITNARGISLNEVLDIVKQKRPVIVWNSMDLYLPYISDSWIYPSTGEKINWMAHEHALLVLGFSNDEVIVSDSLTGTFRYFDRNVFENRYNAFGKRALYY